MSVSLSSGVSGDLVCLATHILTFETISTFSVAYGYSKSDPLTYRSRSLVFFKSSSNCNLYSWRFPLTKLCPLFPKKMFDLVFSQHFIDFDLNKSLAIKRQVL